jgi:hypothetical protein
VFNAIIPMENYWKAQLVPHRSPALQSIVENLGAAHTHWLQAMMHRTAPQDASCLKIGWVEMRRFGAFSKN